MSQVSELAREAESLEPALGLAAVAALRSLLEELELVHVANARASGWSWEAIATSLGVTRQSVHKKHARRLGGRT